MFSRDLNTRTVTFQDKDIKNPADSDEFVKWMNRTVYLFDQDYEGPAKTYANITLENRERYNAYFDLTTQMAKQFTYLCGKLKQQGLPVVMPDYQTFLKEYEKIKTYNDSAYLAAMQIETTLFERSLSYSVAKNIETAKKHNIPLEKPERTIV